MIKNIIKKNFSLLIKFQLNSLLSVTLRSFSIFLFTDILNFNYSLIFWISLIVVSINSYHIQKKYVFKYSNKNSLKRYIYLGLLLAIFEYCVSIFLKTFVNYNVFAFLFAGLITFVTRFVVNRNFVFVK